MTAFVPAMMMAIIMLVYNAAGGPATIDQGTHIQSPTNVVIDQALATAYGAKVGDELIVMSV